MSIGPILLRIISIAALAVCMAAPSLAVDGQTTIAFAESRIGLPSSYFGLGVTGHGHPGKWTIVHDETAAGGLSIEQSSDDPARIKGMSERLIISHYENNYGGAVKRLNLIDERLAKLDIASAAGFLINGLKREQLIAMNSMILS